MDGLIKLLFLLLPRCSSYHCCPLPPLPPPWLQEVALAQQCLLDCGYDLDLAVPQLLQLLEITSGRSMIFITL